MGDFSADGLSKPEGTEVMSKFSANFIVSDCNADQEQERQVGCTVHLDAFESILQTCVGWREAFHTWIL